MPLFEPDRHVQLPPVAWDPARARDWTQRWGDAALEIWEREHGWRLHPRDSEPGSAGPLHGLYLGSAGVWLALARVADAGLCRLPQALPEVLAGVREAYARTPDAGPDVPSWFLGESGILTLSCQIDPDPALADRLADIIASNRDNPTREALWGAPGTMQAALFMYEHTGDERWAALFRDSADALWASWSLDEATGAWLWQQDMYGEQTRYFGAGHGWVGNLHALWRGAALLTAERRTVLRERTVQGLERLALVEGELANWPPTRGDAKLLVQWCHGAPGFLTGLRHAELPEALPLLTSAAGLILRAGPLRKGVGICHGTDGNGVALLEMHRRTGDPTWLAHARQFAMWAIDQSEAERAHHGVWRHSLWTGDAGLACFLLDCLAGTGRGMPGLDSTW